MKKILLFCVLIILIGNRSFAQCGTTISGVLCGLSCNATVIFTPIAGTPPYNLVVTGGPSAQFTSSYTWSGVCAGSYHYDITDSVLSCHDTGTVVVTATTPITAPALSIYALDYLGNVIADNLNPLPTICQFQTIDFYVSAGFINVIPNTFTWKKNGVPVLVQNNVTNYFLATYQTPTLAYGDVITLEVNWPSACMTPNPRISQNITFLVTPNQPPVVTITDNMVNDTICHGNPVTFIANPIDAGTPTYEWYLDATPVGTNQTYTTLPNLLSGSHQVYCIITSNESCDSQDPVFNPVVTSSPSFFYIDPCYYYVPVSGSLGPYYTCGSPFYDSPLDNPVNYSNNVNGLVKFCPAITSQYVTIPFSSIALNDAGDRLRIFAGTPSSTLTADTSTVPLFNLAGPSSSVGSFVVTSTGPGGCLTANFRTDATGVAAGWVASIACTGSPSVGAIHGNLYIDANANCIQDSGETAASGIPVRLLLNNNIVATCASNASGHYVFYALDSIYTIALDPQIQNYGLISSCPNTGELIISSVPSSGNDFGLQCSQGFDLIASVHTTNFRPSVVSHIYPSVSNFHCQVLNGQAHLILPANISYQSTYGPIPTVNGDTLTWNFSFTGPSYLNLGTVNVHTSSSAILGDSITVKFMVEPVVGDSVPQNNTATGSGLVTNSYDPNEKSVSPAASILPDSWLTYTVHFQNTGTASAINISVIDTLESSLDLYSFQPLAASHPYDIIMLDSNVVKFVFNNIMLPDSNANETLSHGWITYRIKTFAGLPNATIINNTAYIYFDFNSAVETNTTVTTIDIPTVIREQNITRTGIIIHPNPVANQFTIYDVRGTILEIGIYNIVGEKILSQLPEAKNQKQIAVDVSMLQSGIYFVKMRSEKGEAVAKFIKQ